MIKDADFTNDELEDLKLLSSIRNKISSASKKINKATSTDSSKARFGANAGFKKTQKLGDLLRARSRVSRVARARSSKSIQAWRTKKYGSLANIARAVESLKKKAQKAKLLKVFKSWKKREDMPAVKKAGLAKVSRESLLTK
jgi:hypothetical protein